VTCERFRSVDGTIEGFICNRSKRRPRCSVCGNPATRLCDAPLRGAKAGRTCDRPLCDDHASRPANVCRPPEQIRMGDHPGVIPGSELANRRILLEPDSYDLCPAHARAADGRPNNPSNEGEKPEG
jgi:hypothetical protein